ncbi:MAG: sce7726 family protein [Terriglobus sp.]
MAPTKRSSDADIRALLRLDLLATHVDEQEVLLLEEFGCESVRADMAVINGCMHCYEIKSGNDSLDRLEKQVLGYGAVFDYVTLVADSRHISKALAKVPYWWGIREVSSKSGSLEIKPLRRARKNANIDKKVLARMLWRKEAEKLLKEHSSEPSIKNLRAAELWKLVGDELPKKVISNAVRAALKQRGGSGFRPPLLRNDGSSPMQSNL